VKDEPATTHRYRPAPPRIATGGEAVRYAMRSKEWRAYAAANGLSGNWSRARLYGMTPKELHALYLEQGACCYLCGDPLSKDLARTTVDHDHSCCSRSTRNPNSNKVSCGKCVRGISCAECNRLIACAHDDPDRLRRIADNLEAANLRVGRPDRVRRSDAPAA